MVLSALLSMHLYLDLCICTLINVVVLDLFITFLYHFKYLATVCKHVNGHV